MVGVEKGEMSGEARKKRMMVWLEGPSGRLRGLNKARIAARDPKRHTATRHI